MYLKYLLSLFSFNDKKSLYMYYIFQIPSTARSSTRSRTSYNPPPVPVLNTRMKNLSQFSFKYKENELPPLHRSSPHVISKYEEQKNAYTFKSSAKRKLFRLAIFSFSLLSIILVLALVLSSPQARLIE